VPAFQDRGESFISKEPELLQTDRGSTSSLTESAHKKTAGARTGGFSEDINQLTSDH
jgi:hypothetical protein